MPKTSRRDLFKAFTAGAEAGDDDYMRPDVEVARPAHGGFRNPPQWLRRLSQPQAGHLQQRAREGAVRDFTYRAIDGTQA